MSAREAARLKRAVPDGVSPPVRAAAIRVAIADFAKEAAEEEALARRAELTAEVWVVANVRDAASAAAAREGAPELEELVDGRREDETQVI